MCMYTVCYASHFPCREMLHLPLLLCEKTKKYPSRIARIASPSSTACVSSIASAISVASVSYKYEFELRERVQYCELKKRELANLLFFAQRGFARLSTCMQWVDRNGDNNNNDNKS